MRTFTRPSEITPMFQNYVRVELKEVGKIRAGVRNEDITVVHFSKMVMHLFEAFEIGFP